MPDEIKTNDFKRWCKDEKGIDNIMTAPFDVWLSCIHEYCDIYYRNDYLKTLNQLAKKEIQNDKRSTTNV